MKTLWKILMFICAISWFITAYKAFHGYHLETWEAVIASICSGVFLLDGVITD